MTPREVLEQVDAFLGRLAVRMEVSIMEVTALRDTVRFALSTPQPLGTGTANSGELPAGEKADDHG